ncbi:MAG: hypothetical protein AB2L22_17825 [Syntrophales bacterium]
MFGNLSRKQPEAILKAVKRGEENFWILLPGAGGNTKRGGG